MVDDATDYGRHLVELHFEPVWRYIDAIREFCGAVAQCTFDDDAARDRISLVVHELVENGIKYGPPAQEDSALHLVLRSHGRDVEVVVTNNIDPAQLQALQAAFASANEGEAFAVYAAAMQRARERPQEESGLGLPRVRYEGQMTLSISVDNGRVSVRATGTV